MIITSSSNKIVKEILEIKRKGKKSSSEFLFFEGQRLVEDVLSSGAVIEKIIVMESLLDKYKALIGDFPYIVVSDKVFKEIAGTVNSQGIGVLAEKPKFQLTPPGELALVVDKVQDPGNLGTIIRTALAAGVESIYLLKGTVNLYNEKTLRSTMGAIYKIPIHLDVELDEIVEMMEKESLTLIKACIDGQYEYNEVPQGKYLIVVGNEGNGISQEVNALPGTTVKIPLYGDIESLNVAVATGIILYGIKSNT